MFDEIAGHLVSYRDDTHTYIVDGKRVKSVSQVVSDTLGTSYANVPEHVLQRASERGTELHNAIEEYERTGKEPQNKTQEFELYQSKRAQYIERVIAQEKIVIVPYEGDYIAGRFDMLAIVDGKRTLIDFKRNSRAYKDKYAMQLELYAQGIKYSYGTTVDRMMIWRFYNDKFQLLEF